MSARIHKVLVLGGYGAFGGRLVELLGADDTLQILVAGRSREKARRYCRSLDTEAQLEPVTVDRDGDIGAAFDRLLPDLVIDTSGPFHAYGHDPYHVVTAAITRGIHYADLADSANFVRGVAQFNAAAVKTGVFALSGLSTCPALTAAAVRHMSRDLSRIDTVTAGIAPSPAADVGESVIRAVAAYAGKPITVLKNGAPSLEHALTDHRDVTVGVPGGLPLFRRRFSLVEVPELSLFGECFPGVRDIWVGAAIAPPVLHRVLTAMARLVRWRLLPSLSPFARLMHWVANRLKRGEHRGGMFVEISGQHIPSTPVTRTWHLVANGARGPYVPVIAAAAVVARCNSGRPPPAGARPATADLELQDFNRYFESLGIEHNVRHTAGDSTTTLYRRVLGSAWLELPGAVRRLHDAPLTESWRGRAHITRGTHWLARLAGGLFRFPRASEDASIAIEFRRERGREIWIRNFAGRCFSSIQFEGHDAYEGLLCERFGPFTFGLATVVEDGQLRLPVRRWDMLGLRLPLWMAPQSRAREYEEDGRFHFDVDISLPFVGPVVRYQGYLVVDSPA